MVSDDVRFEFSPYDYAAASRLARELAVRPVIAQILVRRGYREPDQARAFLDASQRHSREEFGGLRPAAARIVGHVENRSRITVHGDYDADGACSTAILVRVLTALGADVDWYLPSRTEDGYGISPATVERLRARGTQLLITSDCGITAVDEVALARASGIDVVVCDHHSPRADGLLPDAPIVHPRVGGYPCGDLCAAGVAYLLAGALLEAAGLDPALADDDLDLVAIATVADVVSLTGENRSLVRAGLRALASTRKPGLRALMDIAGVDPSAVDATAVSFRLAPRINAVGRIRRADAALELLLTADQDRARAIAAELDECNAERRSVETGILFEAERQVAAAPPDCAAFVLAGEGWHPGVVGIVASRVAERHNRPAVLIATEGDSGSGSGRSIPGFDLLSGLNACADELTRHGGHRAAAGLTIATERIEAFRERFTEHAAQVLTPELLARRERIDAVVSGDLLDLDLAEELERLAPFGSGNPGVSLLVPAATLDDPRPMGEGRHVSFTLSAGGARSRGVCFGRGTRLPVPAGEVAEAAVRLEVNRFNGAVEPRLVLRHARAPRPAPIEVLGEAPSFREGLVGELDRVLEPWPAERRSGEERAGREVLDRRGAGIAGILADLVASGDSVLAVAAHAPRRAEQLGTRVGGFALTSWAALEDDDALADGFSHVVAVDPPPFGHLERSARALPGAGWTHLAWGDAELRFSRRVLLWNFDLGERLRALYRALRAAPALDVASCSKLLIGSEQPERSPALCGRLVRVLVELELVSVDRDGPMLTLAPVSARTSLERSPAFEAYGRRLEEGLRCLTSSSAAAAAA